MNGFCEYGANIHYKTENDILGNVAILIISGLFSGVQNNSLFTGYSYKAEFYDGGILEISEIWKSKT